MCESVLVLVSFIYSFENFCTLAKINITMDEYIVLFHSVISCSMVVFEIK